MNTFTYSGRAGWDLHDALASICDWLQPKSYLEVGVDGGRSVETVIWHSSGLERVVLCDIWNPEYCGHGHRNCEHVRARLERLKYAGAVEFLNGDSHLLLPQLQAALTFDLITVDGDHSAEGGFLDLRDCWPHLNAGGVLVMDDVNHPNYPWLGAVADDFALAHAQDALQLAEASGKICNVTAFQRR